MAYDATHHAQTAYQTRRAGKGRDILFDAALEVGNLKEVARQLGNVSVRTVERMIADGELPLIRVRHRRMIAAEVVHAWIARQNDPARVRMDQEKPPCSREKTAMDSISNRVLS